MDGLMCMGPPAISELVWEIDRAEKLKAMLTHSMTDGSLIRTCVACSELLTWFCSYTFRRPKRAGLLVIPC